MMTRRGSACSDCRRYAYAPRASLSRPASVGTPSKPPKPRYSVASTFRPSARSRSQCRMLSRDATVEALPCRYSTQGRASDAAAVRMTHGRRRGPSASATETSSNGAAGRRSPNGRLASKTIRDSCVTSQTAPPAYARTARTGMKISARRRSLTVGKDGTIPGLGGGIAMTTTTIRTTAVCAASVLMAAAYADRPAANGDVTKLLRMPTVSATQIGFAYANNIWTVERSGGMARRLTSFPGQTTNPHFSPDGKWIAFSGEYAGNVDVYVVPAEGGEPKRLTWHPGADSVQGWMPDGKSIVFASSRATAAPSGAPRFWTVPAQGGVEDPMPLPRAYQGKISPTGTHVAYRMTNSWDDERRNYRGGQNRPIWIVDLKTFDLVSPPWTDSKDLDPVWVGDTVFFLSDRDGVANVW